MKENKEKILSEQEAIDLLFEGNIETRLNVFDNYGNYNYPTDIKMEAPNSASGTPTAILDFRKLC